MGNDLHCSREVEHLVEFANRVLPMPHYFSSSCRPGAVTISGNVSRHARGLALDITAAHPDGRPMPTIDSPELLAIFNALAPYSAHLNELICSVPGVAKNVKAGKWVNLYAAVIHHNHVHMAVDPGVNLNDLLPQDAPHSDEVIADTDGREDMADPVGGVCAPGGGVWVATRDGGIRGYRNAPYYGSVPALKEENRRNGFPFVDIKPGTPEDENAQGYTVFGADGAHYHFDQGVLDAINRGEI